MTVIIQTKNITKKYSGASAVSNASFSVRQGEIVGFVGLNGAGKSTTINMLLGFQKPTEGEVHLFGEKVTLPNAYKSHRRVGFATGDMSLFEGMTGRQYLKFIAKLYKTSLTTDTFTALVDRFSPQLDKKLTTLSRGNKQKIALIAAFMAEPDLVILDEPSSGLDPLMQQHFLNLVREQAQKGTTIFMSSHYLNEVIDVCTRVLLIKDGKLVKDMPASQLEKVGGKLVRVITKKEVSPPKSVEQVERTVRGDEFELQFVFKDKALRLQEWISSLPYLQDFTVNDHSAEAAFQDLYEEEGAA
ncbi:MAG: ABC transporter ATP-binding protein [Candidatus Microsaccharimonas sp.]